ncbi:MAG: DinB family protein [Saprospiraceae bacterium]|nr:DinB family protein [Saprospiraceae bacterium]
MDLSHQIENKSLKQERPQSNEFRPVQNSISRLEDLISCVPKLLHQIKPDTLEEKTSPEKWSKKQILGHLIDSASHHHHRIVRAQMEHLPEIGYDQDLWVEKNAYQQMNPANLIRFWYIYNQHILDLIKLLPSSHFEHELIVDGKRLLLNFLMIDYVIHLEHHLRQILGDDFQCCSKIRV